MIGAAPPLLAELPVTIIIPVYGAPTELAECLASLVRHAPSGCHVVVADDATPDDSIAAVVQPFHSQLRLTYVRRARNLGFVENCNAAIAEVLPTSHDVLLLNSDTEVTAGFLEEMWAVLHLHEKHGVVSPRSNKATILSVPMSGGSTPAASYELWSAIRPWLPRYQVVPTAVGFCLLIKNSVLRQLGAFDPIYSPGYNEENDLICRMNRHGYSALVAHQAFVYHHESSSFGARQKPLEQHNRRILSERYPEYDRKLVHHMRYGVHHVDHFASLWVRPRRQSILFDLYHLPAKHCGTSEFALSLLLRLAPRLEDRYDIRLGLTEEARLFHGQELTGYEHFNARHSDTRFDLVYKPAQLFRWSELYRMTKLGARVAFTHLDIIAVRCDYLSGPSTRTLFKAAADLADRVMTISDFSKSDFEAFYGVDDAPFEVIRPGTHERSGRPHHDDGHILIVGNGFHHKAVQRAVTALEGLAPIVALGGDERPEGSVTWLTSGSLTRSAIAELYDRAAVLIYPSFYEGFGMPVVDALARGVPVIALDTAVNRELLAHTSSSGLVLVADHAQLRAAATEVLAQTRTRPASSGVVRTWDDVAVDYARSFVELLEREPRLDLIQRRWEMLTTLDAVHRLE